MCRAATHNASAHAQACAICGEDRVVKKRVEDVNPNYRCKNLARHETIRKGFGDPSLISEAEVSMAQRRKKDRNQLRFPE